MFKPLIYVHITNVSFDLFLQKLLISQGKQNESISLSSVTQVRCQTLISMETLSTISTKSWTTFAIRGTNSVRDVFNNVILN